jgi:hypothetical protein
MSLPAAGDLDPDRVTTVEEFALSLRRLHVRAGRPSLRELAKWAQAQNAAGRRGVSLTRSGVSDALNGKRLPRKDFVRWFTEACSVPADQQVIWLQAWERVADHHFVAQPEAPPASPPTPGGQIQPVFADLLVVTVFLRGRSIRRRVTERLVTAREDGVAHFLARGYVGTPRLSTVSAHQALWGCEAEVVEPGQPDWPATRLTFPVPLRTGEKAHFAAETILENDRDERDWAEVYVDHHGIARGQTTHGGTLPVSGLTIRVRFDDGEIPAAAWWYENPQGAERTTRPAEPERFLALTGRDAQHTFTERPGRPGEIFGLAFAWPRPA